MSINKRLVKYNVLKSYQKFMRNGDIDQILIKTKVNHSILLTYRNIAK